MDGIEVIACTMVLSVRQGAESRAGQLTELCGASGNPADSAGDVGGVMVMSVGGRETVASAADAVADLYDQHHASLCRLATVLLGDASRAEEVVQEAFLRTYRSWWRIREHDRAHGYVRATVVNLCRSQLRRRMVELRVNRAQWAEEERQATAAPGPGSFGVPDQSEAVVGLRQALGALPTRQREVVVLYYFEDMSVAAIAATVGCSAGTVKSQLAKARHSLYGVMQSDRALDPGGSLPSEQGGTGETTCDG